MIFRGNLLNSNMVHHIKTLMSFIVMKVLLLIPLWFTLQQIKTLRSLNSLTLKGLKTLLPSFFFPYSFCFHFYKVSPHPLLATKAEEKSKREVVVYLGWKDFKAPYVSVNVDEYNIESEGNIIRIEMWSVKEFNT